MLRRVFVTVLAICVLFCVGCQSESEVTTEEVAVSEETEGVSFTDDLGREVTISKPQRVAALTGSLADVWNSAGGTICASVEDAWEDFEITMSKDAVNIGTTKEPSVEKLLMATPDFIIASTKTQANLDMLDTLKATKIPTAYFNIDNFEDYLRVLKICTDITGRADLYQQNGADVQAQIESVVTASKERLTTGEAPKVLVLKASASSIRAKNSSGNVLSEVLHDLGCINIADNEDSLLENLNIEYILEENPDYIFSVQVGSGKEKVEAAFDDLFSESSAWSYLTAVKEGKVYYMDNRLYNFKPNARWGEAYEEVERILANE